jgi:5'-methylthioadenosine phosphorylase
VVADIGVIGGSGLYALLPDAEPVLIDTPWGQPSGPLMVGELAGRRVAFLPRHGVDHRFAPHRVPYKANVWALRSAGVRQLITASAVGSLRADLGTGTVVVPDQILDRTSGRESTYNDADNGVAHVPFADPYCERGRAAAVRAGSALGIDLVTDASMIVINGPRFSSRAESRDFQRTGAAIIGMTGMPEAALAREMALCMTSLCLVTDLDAGVEAGEGVTQDEVMAAFAANLPRLRALLEATVAQLPATQGDCACGKVHSAPPPFELP